MVNNRFEVNVVYLNKSKFNLYISNNDFKYKCIL